MANSNTWNQQRSQTTSHLKIFQWNCHSVTNKIDLLKPTVQEYDVLALSETWLRSDQPFSLHNFHILRKDRIINNSGDLLFAIKKHISYKHLDDCFSIANRLDCIAISIPVDNN